MIVALLTLATFAAVTIIIVSGYYALTAEAPINERLRRLAGEPVAKPKRERRERGMVQAILGVLGEYGFGGGDSSLSQKMSFAGFRGAQATSVFLGARTLVSFGPALFVLVWQVSTGETMGHTLWMAGLTWAFGHTLANHWLRRRAKRRITQISQALPDSLDLMVVCLEAGLGLNGTIARVGQERSSLDDPLGREFDQVAAEMRGGRSREDSLRALGERNGVDDLKALAALVIQSDRLGASMAKTLRVHADLLRTKRRQRAEEAARKLPIKMLFPLAFFILPPLFVMVAGPALLTFRSFVKTMTQQSQSR